MIGIVIVSYKNQESTIAFINEQLPKIGVPWKAIVVDNGPDESVGKAIAERCGGVLLRHPDEAIEEQSRVYVVSPLENLGFARGNNFGADILARNFVIDYFLFSNDDIIISDVRVMEKMLLQFDKRQDVAIVGPRIIGKDNRDQSPHYRIITPLRQIGWKLFRRCRRNRAAARPAIEPPQSSYCYWVSGCFFLVRQSDFSAVGGFDPRTFLYSEEVILSERMKRIGKRSYFMADTSVVHLGGCSTQQVNNRTLHRYLKQSNCIYYRNYLRSNPVLVWLYKVIC